MRDDDPINQGLVMRKKEHPVNQDYGLAIVVGLLLLFSDSDRDRHGRQCWPSERAHGKWRDDMRLNQFKRANAILVHSHESTINIIAELFVTVVAIAVRL
jgi:hypothetical protein